MVHMLFKVPGEYYDIIDINQDTVIDQRLECCIHDTHESCCTIAKTIW